MALKNKDLKKKNEVVEASKEVDAVTGKPFPEAPKKRQGDGVLSGEVPKGHNSSEEVK